ncbi:MAG: response regulator [Chloroherpetonaceae bacterium]|nr:response regulator [Chloroherpetonaceae bacterium]MDW8020439.1 response regulator [Chloroherpetonaceae bacterium]
MSAQVADSVAQRRVLIVDDEENIPVGILKTLSRSGRYYAKHAQSGDIAQQILAQEPFDLVITDLKMPNSKLQGIDLLRHIRTTYPDIGVIVMTAYGSAAVQEEASRRGSLLYIEKPFDLEKLLSVVEDFFTRREQAAKSTASSSTESVQGIIPGLQLMDVIQMNCLSRITSTLHIKRGDGAAEGIICFNKGNITHAETSTPRSGKDAFFEILTWKGGSFDTIEQIPPTVTIVESWEQLMIEAMQMDLIGDATPAETQPNTLRVQVQTTPKEEEIADTSKMLDRVLAGAKAEAAFLVTHTGFVLDKRVGSSTIDLAKSGDEMSKLLPGIFAVGKSIAGGTLNEIVLRFSNKTVMIRNVQGSDILFIVISPASVPSGDMFKAIERESETIKKIL